MEEKKTRIYIKGELFLQCKFLLLNIPEDFSELKSIDDGVDLYYDPLIQIEYSEKVPAQAEFWAHCSNLQAWSEYDYDTRFLHFNLAFPLLKKLTEVGDLQAKKRFKEEIVKRFELGNKNVQRFLLNEGYLDIFTKDELHSLIISGSEIIKELERIIQKDIKIDLIDSPFAQSFILKNGIIIWLILENCQLKEIPIIIKDLDSLERLRLRKNLIENIPVWIKELQKLKYLDLSDNNLKVLPDYIGNFNILNYLYLSNNQLKEIPESIGNLRLFNLEIINNQLRKIPESIGNITSLENLLIHNNKITVLPESIGNIISLKRLVVANNLINSLPESIGKLRYLEELDLSNNPLQVLPDSIEDSKNLTVLYLAGTKINKSSQFIKKLKKKRITIFF
ncbi:MAG: leucine-rich repeat domain-containing protein [Promethearchaeota archaeon]